MSLFLEKEEISFHLENIQSRLENKDFDGPLDLLLTLINRAEIDIKDIFISNITQQYLDLVANMSHKDTDYEADFIEMATRLIRIKSAALLPKLDDDDYNEEDDVIMDLEMYKEYHTNLYSILQEGAEKLRERETLFRFYREPKFTEKDYRVVINDFKLEAMIAAFTNILEKIERYEEQNKVKTVNKETVSVDERVAYLKELLKEKIEIRFFSLFDDATSKEEVVSTFLAVLVLLKRQIAHGVQKTAYGDIFVRLNDVDETELQAEVGDVKEYD